jgi:hypothetical protein
MEILNIRKLMAAAVALIVCAAPQSRGISAYLKVIGPSPLRFYAGTSIPAPYILPKSLIEHLAPTNVAPVVSPATTSIDTNAVAAAPPKPVVLPISPVVLTTTAPQNSSTSTPSASDMLVVSPQMLTEFFKPVTDGTNAPGTVVVPVTMPVGFTPPSATPPSRATYHSP